MSTPEETKAPPSKPVADEEMILPSEDPKDPPDEPLSVPPDKPWLQEWVTDMRLEWLRQKVCIGLNMPRKVFNTVIQTEEGSKQIRSFLDSTSSSLLFYPDEIVTIIETIVEPPPPLPPPSPPPPQEGQPEGEQGGVGEAPAGGEVPESKEEEKEKKDEKKKDKKGDRKGKKGDKKGKKGGKKGKEEPPPEPKPEPKKDDEGEAEGSGVGGDKDGEGGEAPKEEAKIEEPPKPQIVHAEKRDPILCASTGILPEKALSQNVVYFLKMKSGSVTEEQLNNDLESGVLPGGPGVSALEMVIQVIKHPFY